MKRIILSLSVILCTIISTRVNAQNTDPMKAWQEYMTPGDMHKWLAKHVGTWEAEVSQWLDPAQPPAKSKATEVVTMTLNGLYQVSNYSGDIMGMPMSGQATLGYNNAKKIFELTWIDNMGSGIIFMTGTYDAATKTLTLKGKQTDPMTGQDSDIRQVNKFIDDDSYTMTMYGAGMDGKEAKFMEGTYKRKK